MTTEIFHSLGGGTYLVEEKNGSGISHFKLNNNAGSGGIYACASNLYAAGERLQEIARDKGYEPFPKEPAEPQPESEPVPADFQVGARVQVVTDDPRFGWGFVNRFDVGTVTVVDDDGDIEVDFPNQDGWLGRPHEFVKIPSPFPSPFEIVDDVVETKPRTPRYVNLTDQAKTIFRHIMRAGSISAREAMNDYGITSATLARRICDLEDEGYEIARVQKTHPITQRKYTRYTFPGGVT